MTLQVPKENEVQIRCALLGTSYDLPAGRKLCGFLGHNAHLGCSRCKKEFHGSVGNQNFSGFDRENWVPRDDKSHRHDALKLALPNTN